MGRWVGPVVGYGTAYTGRKSSECGWRESNRELVNKRLDPLTEGSGSKPVPAGLKGRLRARPPRSAFPLATRKGGELRVTEEQLGEALRIIGETAYVARAFASLPHRDGRETAIEGFLGARYFGRSAHMSRVCPLSGRGASFAFFCARPSPRRKDSAQGGGGVGAGRRLEEDEATVGDGIRGDVGATGAPPVLGDV